MGRTDNNGLATLERIGSPGSIGETENDGLRKSGDVIEKSPLGHSLGATDSDGIALPRYSNSSL